MKAGPIQSYLAFIVLALGTARYQVSANDALVSEVVAGQEANRELLQFGTAQYEITREEFYRRDAAPKSAYAGPHKTSVEFRVVFDYPHIRTETNDERVVHRPDHAIVFRTKPGPQASYPAYEYSAIIEVPSAAPIPLFHPGIQHEIRGVSFIDRIRSARDKPHLGIQVTAKKADDGLIEINIDSPASFWRGEYWIDPDQGYQLVRGNQYALKSSSDQPVLTFQAGYQQVSGGAFILNERQQTDWINLNGDLLKRSHTDMRLTSFDDAKPDPTLFQLESLGLPVGARITDRINKKHYVYGVSAVTEADIPTFGVTGPDESNRPFPLGMIFVAAAMLLGGVAIGLWFRRERA
jgi:hypothetical protein